MRELKRAFTRDVFETEPGGEAARELAVGQGGDGGNVRPWLIHRLPAAQPGLPEDWELVRKLGLKQLDRSLSLVPRILRGDDPEAIHDLRVATRRLQQIVDLAFPRPRPKRIQRLKRRIKRCRRSLSEARNYDVLLGRVDAALRRKRTARREVWIAIHDYLAERRATCFEKSLGKFAKANLTELRVRLKAEMDDLGNNGPPESPEASALGAAGSGRFSTRVAGNLERVWGAFEDQVNAGLKDLTPASLHALRISAKRVRYLVEVIHAFEVPGSGDTLTWLRDVQQRLGDWHDSVVFEQMMIEMIADQNFLHDHLELALGIEKLVLKTRGMRKRLEREFLEGIENSPDRGRTRNWVGHWISRFLRGPSEAEAPSLST